MGECLTDARNKGEIYSIQLLIILIPNLYKRFRYAGFASMCLPIGLPGGRRLNNYSSASFMGAETGIGDFGQQASPNVLIIGQRPYRYVVPKMLSWRGQNLSRVCCTHFSEKVTCRRRSIFVYSAHNLCILVSA